MATFWKLNGCSCKVATLFWRRVSSEPGRGWFFIWLANGRVIAGFSPLACFLKLFNFFRSFEKLNDIYSNWHAVPCHLNRKIAIKMQKNYEGKWGLRLSALFFRKRSAEKSFWERKLGGMFLAQRMQKLHKSIRHFWQNAFRACNHAHGLVYKKVYEIYTFVYTLKES